MMKEIFPKAMLAALALSMLAGRMAAQVTPASQMEFLKRGVVALKNDKGDGVFVSWRYLGTDDPGVTFNVLRDGEAVAEGLSGATYYIDEAADPDVPHDYVVETVLDGTVIDTSDAAVSSTDFFHRLTLERPSHSNTSYEYTPNDCSIADLDGDGEYELIVKWDPTNSRDNSESGKTAKVFIDAYKFDGTRMWRLDLGYNIRAGAHYTQMLVYDFDGDGKAEMIIKTAPGTKDSSGAYVSEAADDEEIVNGTDNDADYRNSNGHVAGGQEYLTVFDGETGRAIHTIYYNPNRAGSIGGSPYYGGSDGNSSFWGDKTYNRGERYLACVAYLDGPDANPSAVMCRGYYTRAYLWAVDFDGSKLSTKWLHASTSSSSVTVTDADGNSTTTTYSSNTSGNTYSYTAYGNGNHNLSVADVDGDGCDEIIYGACGIDNDGSLMYATGFGHGDAMHLSDLCPDRPGLEVFEVHEEKHPQYGADVHDAATGEIIWSYTGSGDNGRGMAADVDEMRGFECWSSNDRQVRSCVTGDIWSTKSQSQCFRLYWDGDEFDELFDGKYDSSSLRCSPAITKYNGTGSVQTLSIQNIAFSNEKLGSCMTCNTTKATPNLIADLWGDWREEIIMWDRTDSVTLNIFTSTYPTEYRIPTLMHDHTYRMGVAWENVCYNQPPHLGFYLPDYLGLSTGIGKAVTVGEGWIRMPSEGTLEISSDGEAPTVIAIYDVSGRKVWGESLTVSGTQTVSLPGMAAGLYVLRATSGVNSYQRKFAAR